MRDYQLRYSVEDWNKPPDLESQGGKKVAESVTVSANDYGYCDDIFIASIMREGGAVSVLLLGKDGNPSRQVLELVRDTIDKALCST